MHLIAKEPHPTPTDGIAIAPTIKHHSFKDSGWFGEALDGQREPAFNNFYNRHLYSLRHHAIDILYHLKRNLFFDDTFYGHFYTLLDDKWRGDLQRKQRPPQDDSEEQESGPNQPRQLAGCSRYSIYLMHEVTLVEMKGLIASPSHRPSFLFPPYRQGIMYWCTLPKRKTT